MPLFDVEYLRKTTNDRYMYNGLLIGTYMYTHPTQRCDFE